MVIITWRRYTTIFPISNVGILAAQQESESTTKVLVLPRVDQRIHTGIGHGQGEGELVQSRGVVPDHAEHLYGDHDEIGQPADGETAED